MDKQEKLNLLAEVYNIEIYESVNGWGYAFCTNWYETEDDALEAAWNEFYLGI